MARAVPTLQGVTRLAVLRTLARVRRGSAVPGPLLSSSWGWADTSTGTLVRVDSSRVTRELG